MANKKRMIFAALIAVIVLPFGLEIGYRLYLRVFHAEFFSSEAASLSLPPIGVYDRSLWEFDSDLGYNFAKGLITLSHVDGGQVTSCSVIRGGNKRGNRGRIKGKWETANLKIAVFGDGYSALTTKHGLTWANLLQDDLARKTGKAVNIVNFGRGDMGVVQMFNAAAAKVPEWKPDLALLVFSTTQLRLRPQWRVAAEIAGESRVLTVTDPGQPPNLGQSSDSFILHPKATLEWCQNISYQGRLDPVGTEIVQKYIRFRKPGRHLFSSILIFDQSFLYNRLVKGDPLAHVPKTRTRHFSPFVPLDDTDWDNTLMAGLERLRATGVPFAVIHIPTMKEVSTGKEYIANEQEARLLAVLEEAMGGKPIGLLPYAPKPIPGPDYLVRSQADPRPSIEGMKFIAQAVSALVRLEGLGVKR